MLFSKCNGNKIRDDTQLDIAPPAQNTSTEKILEDNLKVSNQFHIDDLIKTLSEMKNGKSQDAYKQNYVVSKMNEPATILGSLKYEPSYLQLLHIAEGVDILDKNVNNKETANSSILINDIPKLHISGHILSMGSNNLPSINVLSTNSISGGSLVTQYTDRWRNGRWTFWINFWTAFSAERILLFWLISHEKIFNRSVASHGFYSMYTVGMENPCCVMVKFWNLWRWLICRLLDENTSLDFYVLRRGYCICRINQRSVLFRNADNVFSVFFL